MLEDHLKQKDKIAVIVRGPPNLFLLKSRHLGGGTLQPHRFIKQ